MKKLIIKDMADVCEEAHKLTVKECKKLKITVAKNKLIMPDQHHSGGFEVTYTDKAQEIFDKHYNYLIEKYNI